MGRVFLSGMATAVSQEVHKAAKEKQSCLA